MLEILFLLWVVLVYILNKDKKTIILGAIAFVLGVISIQLVYQSMDLLDFEPGNQKAMLDNSTKLYITLISAICILSYLSVTGILKQVRNKN